MNATNRPLLGQIEYLDTQRQIFFVAQLVEHLPLDAFIRAGQRSDVLAPLIDPTLWQRGHANLNDIIQIAIALREFQRVSKDKIAQLRDLIDEVESDG